MRLHSSGVGAVVAYLSLAEAVAVDHHGKAGKRDFLDGLRDALGMGDNNADTVTMTETMRQTMTVGGDGGGAGLAQNASTMTMTMTMTVTAPAVVAAAAVDGAVGADGAQLSFLTTTVFGDGPAPTVTMTALASTVTQTVTAPCQVQGAAQASGDVPVAGGAADTAPAVGGGAPGADDGPHGGIGVTVVSVPPNLRTTTKESPPRVSSPAPAVADGATTSVLSVAAPTLLADPAEGGASSLAPLAPLPTDGGASSLAPLAPLPAADSVAAPVASAPSIASAPAVETSAAAAADASAPSLAPLPALDSGATSVQLGAIGAEATTAPNGDEAVAAGGAAAVAPAVTTVPEVANGGAQPSIDVSGLTLNSVINLGNLQPAVARRHTLVPGQP